ncbi:MAG: hypothetical protein IEMM0008_1919 [bacterium]|nr:MAG: hypothetical protein IEMM0008_1919 [bacterium]
MKRRMIILFLVIFTFTLTSRAKSPSDKLLWDKIQRSYDKKPYRVTLSYIREFLKSHAKSKYALEARILKEKVNIHLRRRMRGIKYLNRLIHRNNILVEQRPVCSRPVAMNNYIEN